MIKVGIIGCGDMGRIHAESLRALQGVFAASFCDTNTATAEKLAASCNGAVYNSPKELLESGIDCVYICTRHDSHAELVNMAIAHKKAVFCEKPLAYSLDDAKSLYWKIKESGLPFMIGFNQRFAPAILALKDYLKEKGDHPTNINLSVSCVNFLDAWMGKPEQGGGILPSLLCHELDLLRFIMEEEIDSLACMAERLRLPPGYNEDGGAVICRFKSGCIAGITFHDHSHPEYVFDPMKDMIRLELHTGKKSMVSYAHDKFTVCDEQGISSRQFGPFSQLYSWGYTEINRRFMEALEQGQKPCPNERDGLVSAMLVQAARESMEQKTFRQFDWDSAL